MSNSRTSSGLQIRGRIDRQTHRVDDLRSQADDWDKLDESERLSIARETEPVDTETIYNVTTDRFHEYFVDNLDRNQTDAKDNLNIEWAALGDDSGSGTNSSDTDLNNRVYSEKLSGIQDNGNEILSTLFLDAAEGNGNTYDEIGLFSGNPANVGDADVFMFNHATFSPVLKNDQKSLTFDVTITFTDF